MTQVDITEQHLTPTLVTAGMGGVKMTKVRIQKGIKAPLSGFIGSESVEMDLRTQLNFDYAELNYFAFVKVMKNKRPNRREDLRKTILENNLCKKYKTEKRRLEKVMQLLLELELQKPRWSEG